MTPNPANKADAGEDTGLVTAQLLMTTAQMHQLTQLAASLNLDVADAVNTALSLLGWALDEQAAGRIVGSIDEASGSYKELDFTSPRPAQSLN